MKYVTILIFATLFPAASAVYAGDVQCPSRGPCIASPVVPAPPVPPAPRAPPPPPPMPAVPKEAHQACAGKAAGAPITFIPRKGEFMAGTCEVDSKGMYFSLQSYHSAD